MDIKNSRSNISRTQCIGFLIIGFLVGQSSVQSFRRRPTLVRFSGNATLSSGSTLNQASTSNSAGTSAATAARMQSNANTILNNRISLTNNIGAGSFYSNVSMGNVTIAPSVNNSARGGLMNTKGADGNTLSSSLS
jgi:hypothetical protein